MQEVSHTRKTRDVLGLFNCPCSFLTCLLQFCFHPSILVCLKSYIVLLAIGTVEKPQVHYVQSPASHFNSSTTRFERKSCTFYATSFFHFASKSQWFAQGNKCCIVECFPKVYKGGSSVYSSILTPTSS